MARINILDSSLVLPQQSGLFGLPPASLLESARAPQPSWAPGNQRAAQPKGVEQLAEDVRQRVASQARAVGSALQTEAAEEVVNTLTHGLGLALSVVGGGVLVFCTHASGSTGQLVGCLVYGLAAIALYAASTLYHAATAPRLKRCLQFADHACIYLFIAGTYTPFLLTALRGPLGTGLLVLIWTMAAGGILLKLANPQRLDSMTAWPYVAMGWVIIGAAKPLFTNLAPLAIVWLLAGGVAYTAGVWFYKQADRLYYHSIWHLFVLAGTVCHFCAVATGCVLTV
mgnify:CR=1 FL=1